MKNEYPILPLIFMMLLVGCQKPDRSDQAAVSDQNQESVEAHSHQGDEEGHDHNHVLPGMKHGFCQSPINIVTSKVEGDGGHKVIFDYESSSEDVKNLGHTVEVEYDAGSSITFDGRTFDFVQFHFHTPSEHLVDGASYPMEMHMVHTLRDQPAGEETNYLVVGLLFKEGAENAFLNEFVSAIPKVAGDEEIVEGGTVNVNDLLKQASSLSYYHYQGSLTTPPYSETVTWLVVKDVFDVSKAQLETFKKLEGHNARHVQALHGREIDQ